MSNATNHSRQSGDSQRRRSRGGRNRNAQRRSGDRDGRDGRENRESRDNRGRAEEFRPQSPRSPRVPVKLSWWQKLLKAIGLYKEPQPTRGGRRSGPPPAAAAEARPAKSNTRNARTSEEATAEPRGGRNRDRARGGDRSTVESPRVYVGNLSYDVTEQDLQELFKGIGGVRNVEIVYNRSTHRSKGYGFVEMLHMDEAIRAVEVLHDQPFMGRKLMVSGAKSKGQDEREERDERPEGAARPIVVAPRPAAAAPAKPAEPAEPAEPELSGESEPVASAPVAVEPVTPVADAPAEPVAEEPADPVIETVVEAVLPPADEQPAETETKQAV